MSPTDVSYSKVRTLNNAHKTVADLLELLLTPPSTPIEWPRKDAPHYKQYRHIYTACQIMCMDRFCPGITQSLFDDPLTPQVGRNVILGHFAKYEPLDDLVAEAFGRFLSLAMDAGYTSKMIPLFAVLLSGVSLMAAAATLLVRDLTNVVVYAFRLLLYSSPIVYPLSRVEGLIDGAFENEAVASVVLAVYTASPLNIATQMVRGGLYDDFWVPGWMWGALAIEAGLSLAIGALVFWRVERWIIKMI